MSTADSHTRGLLSVLRQKVPPSPPQFFLTRWAFHHGGRPSSLKNEICPNPLLSKPITTVASGILSGFHRYFMSCISQDIGYLGPISRLLGELLAKRGQRRGKISWWLLATAKNAYCAFHTPDFDKPYSYVKLVSTLELLVTLYGGGVVLADFIFEATRAAPW